MLRILADKKKKKTCSGSSLMSKTEDHKMENVQVGIILKEIQNQ